MYYPLDRTQLIGLKTKVLCMCNEVKWRDDAQNELLLLLSKVSLMTVVSV